MKYIAEDIKININELINTHPREAVIKSLRLDEGKVKNFALTRTSIDSRFHNSKGIFYCVSASFDYPLPIRSRSVKPYEPDSAAPPAPIKLREPISRPIIIGSGPAGLFCALRLIESGIAPIIIERGSDLEQRSEDVRNFNASGILQPNSNVQFGLGGAGTFSDGKLNSRIKTPYTKYVAERFVEFGAKREITYMAKPHIGTDKLRGIIRSMREYILNNGGQFVFNTTITEISRENGRISAVSDGKTRWEADDIFLAVGNSARDTLEMLDKFGVRIEAKPFAVGVRVEHKQELIDSAIYGSYAKHPMLGAAEYFLKYSDAESGRGVYSFCNCPGGLVINASSEYHRLCVNGMSYSKRKGENANSAIVVSVKPEDFGFSGALGGIQFARALEERAFELGGGDFSAPVMSIADFLGMDAPSDCTPSILPNYRFADLRQCLPEFITEPLSRAFSEFCKRIPGFERGVMTAVETRSSAPYRILRDEDTLMSVSTMGLYPIGEGSGYAGGIMSSAVDGVRAADKMAEKYTKGRLV